MNGKLTVLCPPGRASVAVPSQARWGARGVWVRSSRCGRLLLLTVSTAAAALSLVLSEEACNLQKVCVWLWAQYDLKQTLCEFTKNNEEVCIYTFTSAFTASTSPHEWHLLREAFLDHPVCICSSPDSPLALHSLSPQRLPLSEHTVLSVFVLSAFCVPY